MNILNGIGVSEGINFGKIIIFNSNCINTEKIYIDNTDLEIKRYEKALNDSINHTNLIYKKVLNSMGESEANIFKSHEIMLNDIDFKNSVKDIILNENTNAEYAIYETSKKFSKFFSDMSSPYMQNRALDVIDISKCLLSFLNNKEISKLDKIKNYNEPLILASNDFTPSEISSMDKNKIKALLCSEGSYYSHTAILARVMKIPMIISIKNILNQNFNELYTIVDSISGKIYINPEDSIIEYHKNKKTDYDISKKTLESIKELPTISVDGKKIKLYANMNCPDEIEQIIESNAEGIGLLRSEFIYLDKEDFPSEDCQFEIYKNIIKKMNNKNVIIRTVDIGSDKKLDYFNTTSESNPAMGYRGIRVCLDNHQMFKSQLKAIYRASIFGNVSVMFPMIISIKEVLKIKSYINEIKNELNEQNITFNKNVKIGVMIETPAAVMISDEISKEVDFLSIGTNDLTQYVLAVDRQNNKVNSLFDTHNKSVLRMIKIVIENAHKNGIWAGICGESACDETLINTYLSLGIDELSMSAPFILKIKKKILETNISEIKNKTLSDI